MASQGYLCDFCSEIFVEENELRSHVKDDHKIDWYTPTEFSTSSDSNDQSSLSDVSFHSFVMKKKRRSAAPARIFTCDKCDYKTKVKSSMKVHKLVHTLDCPYCEYKTVWQQQLKEHIVTDHLGKPNLGLPGGEVVGGGEKFIL